MRKIVAILILVWPISVSADVFINEIAWMGTVNSANDEWIEIYNSDNTPLSVDGWVLKAADDSPVINLSGEVPGNGYFLLERTDDSSVSGILADIIYTGSLSNNGEHLILINSSGQEVDSVNNSSGWQSGDNNTKETMQRTSSGWISAEATPKSQNMDDGLVLGTNTNNDKNLSSHSSSVPISEGVDVEEIFIYAGRERTASVGVPIRFSAFARRSENGPRIENVNITWSFGDGTTKNGTEVSHYYNSPGKYVVVVRARISDTEAVSRTYVNVVPFNLSFGEFSLGVDGYVYLTNNSSNEINVGGFYILNGDKKFFIPGDTIILPGQKIKFDKNNSFLTFQSSEFWLFSPNDEPILRPDHLLNKDFSYEMSKDQVSNFDVDLELKRASVIESHNSKNDTTDQISDETEIITKKERKVVILEKRPNFLARILAVPREAFSFIKNMVFN